MIIIIIIIILLCCSGIGLLYVNASVYQMLRGSIIIFTGILSVSTWEKLNFCLLAIMCIIMYISIV